MGSLAELNRPARTAEREANRRHRQSVREEMRHFGFRSRTFGIFPSSPPARVRLVLEAEREKSGDPPMATY